MFHLICVNGYAIEPHGEGRQVVRMIKLKNGFRSSVRHDRVEDHFAMLATGEELARKLMSQGHVKPKAARLVECNSHHWIDKILKLIEIQIVRLNELGRAGFVLATRFDGRPQVREKNAAEGR